VQSAKRRRRNPRPALRRGGGFRSHPPRRTCRRTGDDATRSSVSCGSGRRLSHDRSWRHRSRSPWAVERDLRMVPRRHGGASHILRSRSTAQGERDRCRTSGSWRASPLPRRYRAPRRDHHRGAAILLGGMDLKRRRRSAGRDYGVGGFGGLQQLPGLNKPSSPPSRDASAAVSSWRCRRPHRRRDHARFALPEIKIGHLATRRRSIAAPNPASRRDGPSLHGDGWKWRGARWGSGQRNRTRRIPHETGA